MAFPFLLHENFEDGTKGIFDTETDTASQLDIAHYTTLAAYPWATATPFSGAYCARWVLSGGTADAILIDPDMDISADGTGAISFNVWFSPNFTGTANDTVHLFELQASATVELAVGFRVVAATGVINAGIGETAPTVFGATALERGQWYTFEVVYNIDNGVGNDGDASLYVTKVGGVTQLTAEASVSTLDQGAITDGVLGVQNHLATTTGVILMDNFIHDDARVYPRRDRFPEHMILTKSSHVFVGPGCLENITLIDGGSGDSQVNVYDTDRADITDFSNSRLQLESTANGETVDPAGVPLSLARGCYVVLAGTNPKAIVKVCRAPNYSVQGYKRLGLRSL